MTFLRNAWYCAGFGASLPPGGTLSITMLGEPVVLYRSAAGKAAALADRCPHRFAPLSLGQVFDDTLRCPYHGLRFDATGQCTDNPHGDRTVPKAARVQAYPLLERHGALWVWIGDAERADPALLPDFSTIDERAGWAVVHGQLHVQANYQLISDNLLDLSHVQFLHPFLQSAEPPPPEFRYETGLESTGDTVTALTTLHHCPTSSLYQMLWPQGSTAPSHVRMRAHMRWDAPSLLLLDTGSHPEGGQREDGPSAPSAHWLTPETATTTHYFWVVGRDTHVADAAMSEQLAAGIGAAFAREDEPMIEACQRRMNGADLMSLKPVLLAGDGPAMRARRILAQKLEAAGG